MTERLSNEELAVLVEDLRIWASAADERERISAAYATGKIDAHQTSPMGDDLRKAATHIATLQREVDEMREALSGLLALFGDAHDDDEACVVRARAALKALPQQERADKLPPQHKAD